MSRASGPNVPYAAGDAQTTFGSARPLEAAMHTEVRALMTTDVVTVSESAPFKEIVRLMSDHGVSALPVTDGESRITGLVSEADLLRKEEFAPESRSDHYRPSLRARLRHHLTEEGPAQAKAAGSIASELMSAPAVTIGPDSSVIAAARLMDRHGIKRLPVTDGDGRVLGVISRRDVLRVFVRPDSELEEEVRREVVVNALWAEPEAVHVSVAEGVVTLSGRLENRTRVRIAERLTGAVEGVVEVVNELEWDYDDLSAETRGFRV